MDFVATTKKLDEAMHVAHWIKMKEDVEFETTIGDKIVRLPIDLSRNRRLKKVFAARLSALGLTSFGETAEEAKENLNNLVPVILDEIGVDQFLELAEQS